MANLRLKRIKASDSTTIVAEFTNLLDPLLDVSNVSLLPNLPSLPIPEVLKVKVKNDVIVVTIQPMTPMALYYVTFKNGTIKFRSKNLNDFLLEDGKTNVATLVGPIDPANTIKDKLIEFIDPVNNVYNIDGQNNISKIINHLSTDLTKALHDVRQAKNDNYLGFTVFDELKTRGKGPYDRLNEEGAYEVIRVGLNQTSAPLTTTLNFSSFPEYPITLQSILVTNEQLSAGVGRGTFTDLVLTVANDNVTKLNSLTIAYYSGSTLIFDLSSNGYRILETRYDPNVASPNQVLASNQFALPEVILEDSSFVLPVSGDKIIVSYEYKNKGRIIDEESIRVSQILNAVREVVPPIAVEFTLAKSPVVNALDVVQTFGGIEFLDPLANPPLSATHPAFTREITYRFDGLPSTSGDFAVEYETGRVVTYGETLNDGTGNFPPLANYSYRNVFDNNLDYIYNPETYELVRNPLRDLAGQSVTITFDYEQALLPEVDFKAQVHQEVLDERIENRLKSTISLITNNTPITNVFRIFNETSGEIYSVQRWNDNTIFFNSNIPPKIQDVIQERARFTDVLNEILISESELINILGTRVLRIPLSNNRIMSASEDAIGSSFNSSASFSRTDIFTTELYFDWQILTETDNIDRLLEGQYQIDYQGGTLFLGTSLAQGLDLGTMNYKKSTIDPKNSHVIAVSEIYHKISNITGINKRIALSSFGEDVISPQSFDNTDERFLGGDLTMPYIVSSGTITVTDDVRNVRGIFDVFDLNNNIDVTNFGENVSISNNIITLGAITKQEVTTIGLGLVVSATDITPGAEISGVSSVKRISDGVQLYDIGGSFTNYDITLSGTGSPSPGEEVEIIYELSLNSSATPVVDYNRGDYFINYNYLVDEILVSYEYGDNVLDFRESNILDPGTDYYVTYKVGALRDSLLKNFGSLVDIPILNNFDTTLPRENYRDALSAALQSFTKGPTLPSMKLLVSTITKIDPDIIEAIFEVWSLGVSYLYRNAINYTGDLQLLPSKYDNGVSISNSDESVSFPASSNLRLEEGTLETWVVPEWNGLDNDASLTFTITKDGNPITSSEVFIGSSSFNPEVIDGTFIVNKFDIASPDGIPGKIFTDTGLFVYLNETTNRWNILAKDKVAGDGYTYDGTITSSGELYDVQFIPGLGEINDILRSSSKKVTFQFNLDGYDVLSPDGYNDGYNIIDGYIPGDGYSPGYSYDGITLMSDNEHYLFDFGRGAASNRFSLYKDGKGYLNFRVYDKGNAITGRTNQYKISTDISSWSAGEEHHVAISWKLNTNEKRDEMHLFIDGAEATNIMRYGGRPISATTDRFRTVKPEIISGTIPLNIVTAADMTTVAGSNIVSSASVNFDTEGILIGQIIEIKEIGFGTYTISSVSGNTLVIDSPAPSSLSDARFSVNPYSVIVSTEIDLAANIAISIASSGVETEIPGLRADVPAYEISKNAYNQNVLTILGSAQAGDQIYIRTLGLNHRRCRERHYIWGNTSNVIRTQLPPPINLDEADIYAILMKRVPIGPNNATLVGDRFFASGLLASQPSNSSEGRTLSVTIDNNNVDFSLSPIVTIFGTTAGGPVSEAVTFTTYGTLLTTNKFLTITSVSAEATALLTSNNTLSVEIKEAYSLFKSEGNNEYPVVRFSYKTQQGTTLSGTGDNIVTDLSGFFAESMVGQSLVIASPVGVAGTYTITSRIDNTNITISPTPPMSFSSGAYSIYNASLGRSGFQNGFFTLEKAGGINDPFLLKEGWYEFDYATYLEVPFTPMSDQQAFVGSDLYGNNQAKAIIDEFRILSEMITDVRIGESLGSRTQTITTSFNSLVAFTKRSNTLMLLHFNSLPFINDTDYWTFTNKEYVQSGESVNTTFDKSIVLSESPLVFNNAGLLSTASEGSIEFWVSPKFDTYNDPNVRFYFDAATAIVEETISITTGSVKLSGSTSQVLSVRLQTDTNDTGQEYFQGGSIGDDFRTLFLGKALPSQQTPIKISYIPQGLSGDRISIFKDEEGFITFNVKASGIDFQARQPVFWARDTWHRVKATYKFNRIDNQDEIRLFIDGEEKGAVRFGSGLLFGQGAIFGQGFAGVDNSILLGDINFNDPINQIFIGSNFQKVNTAQARIDNLRLSDTSRNPTTVGSQPFDINYSTNLSILFPVTEDAFTTFLLDFNTLLTKADDFAILRDEKFGIFNFDITVIDSFDIVLSNSKIKQILETLISKLKPAQSKVNITYIQ